MARGRPLSLGVYAIIVIARDDLGARTPVWFALNLSAGVIQLGRAYVSELAGRALSAHNPMIFAGVFVVQCGIGLMAGVFQALGWAEKSAFQDARAVYLLWGVRACGYFFSTRDHNPPS